MAVVWSAVLGVKKQNITGAVLVFILGLVRDVLLVNRLGQSSVVLLAVWSLAVIITSKLTKNLFSAVIPALTGYLIFSLLETGKINFPGIAITAVISVIVIGIWALKDSRESGIKVRLSS